MSRHLSWLLPLIAVIIYAPFSGALDLAISKHFFFDDQFHEVSIAKVFYKLGEFPGLLLGAGSILVYLSTYVTDRFAQWRKAAAVVAIVFLVGPGLLVNGVFKEFWGRSRPRMVEQFGGANTFSPFYKPNFSADGYGNKSFPSGHVSMGFFFFALALAAEREGWMKTFYAAFVFAFVLGSVLTLVRVSQGGHFFSDCVMAAVIMWWLSLAGCRFIYGPKEA
ncbi:MAG: phosphatase PAP2 family protein [Chlamydiales bacterium]|nr:phosphatase PAP2 family protein [Chlamydiales bacterium]